MGSLEAGKGKNIDSPLELPERSAAQLIPSFQPDPFQTSDLQNCKIIYLHCIKLLSLWQSSKRKLIEEPYVLTTQAGKRRGLNPHYVNKWLLLCVLYSAQSKFSKKQESWSLLLREKSLQTSQIFQWENTTIWQRCQKHKIVPTG